MCPSALPMMLSRETVHGICPTKARLPSYNVENLSPGILHFGLGNFHRAHQARYLHDLLEQGLDHDWAIVGAGALQLERPHYHRMQSQDCMYTLIEQSPSETHNFVIGSIIDYVQPADTDATLDQLMHPQIRIVSLTITEGGYFLSAETGSFDATHPKIVEEAAALRSNQPPSTVFGLLVHALYCRRERGIAPFTVLSCDNIPHNGNITRAAVVGLATLVDSSLGTWIDSNITFPNSMVDRITPATNDVGRAAIKRQIGLTDDVPVYCEEFRQWVLEDKFVSGRPQLEKVGVRMVPDVAPYERMKLRMLNGGHAALAYPAALLGIEHVHDAMKDPDVTAFLRKLELEDIMPMVGEVPGTNLDDYLDVLIERLGNPNVLDTTRRLCFDGSNRQPKFITGSIGDNLDECRIPRGLALVCALWCRYCYGVTEDGTEIGPNDPHWEALHQVAKLARDEPHLWLEQKEVYADLSHSEGFVEEFTVWLKKLWVDGVRETLKVYIYGPAPSDGLVQ